ncbi:unnamed protein product [Cylindrotheca closterium]|uniref:CRC domain-containing protein n=1 Tax=Cylindrotheca closterium TaxID=2856 RepID=A0AAD2FU53_9STRA|nr:unnamed protein product [Cylindrotheca closterium]
MTLPKTTESNSQKGSASGQAQYAKLPKNLAPPPPPTITNVAPGAMGGPTGPPPPRHAAHRFYTFPGAVPFDPTDRGAPGPYTAAQYEKARAGMGLPHYAQPPPPPGARGVQASNSGSPKSQLNRGRDQAPPRPHYPPPMHGPPDRHSVAQPHSGSYPQMEHRPPHWPSGGARFPPPTFAQPYPHPPGADHVHHAQPGPYRYSDSSLRREAVSRLTSADRYNVQLDDREGATSPSQIETSHREEVTTMGCTCKKTKCLKLYCQCFAVKIYCGSNCRCLGCCNTQAYEKDRKEAIRNILARNPTAFDTKFKKTSDGQIIIDKAVPAPAPLDRSLAHKLGCKCRKSACVKKYCECYAGGVKCSANCRCSGCKNMPIGGFGNGPPSMTGTPILPSTATTQPAQGGKTNGSPRPGWMMNAAQNLAFLKHASPAAQKAKRMSIESVDMGSMPSLASEGSSSPSAEAHGNGSTKTKTNAGAGISASIPANATSGANTNQAGDRGKATAATATKGAQKKIEEATSSEKTAVSALLMAAVAMTEMVSTDDGETATPPAKTTSSREPMEVDFETPQKNLLDKFNSPKRKVGDREVPKMPAETGSMSEAQSSSGDDDSPKRDFEGNNTPHSNQQKVKRSRIGSHKKFSKTLGNDLDPKQVASDVIASTDFSTPNTKGQFKTADLTPVSARCIDFRNMHVNETTTAKAEN